MEKYGKVLNKTEVSSQYIADKTRYALSKSSGLPVPWDSFNPLYQQALSTYRMICAVRKMQLPGVPADPLSDSGNRINLEILLADSPIIPDHEYLLQPEGDLRMELNRLRIVGSIYDMIFRNLSISAVEVRLKCMDIEKATEHFDIPSPRVSEFITSMTAMQYEAENGRSMLLEGNMSVYQHQARLNDIINSIQGVMDAFYRQHKVALEIIPCPTDITVEADPRDIKQALMNILMAKPYALRRTEKAKVTMGSSTYGNSAVIYITDNGPQIPHKDANMIFAVAKNAPVFGWKYDLTLAERAINSSGGEVRARNMEKGVEEKIFLPCIQ